MGPKHIPERSCVACRSKRPKRDLVRIVRTPEGMVKPDPSGRMNGRGAYLCQDAACWVQGVTKDRLKAALGVTLTAEAKTGLLEYAEKMFGGEAATVLAAATGKSEKS